MSEQALDLRSAGAVVRRHRRLIAALGLIGLLGGAAYALTKPPEFSSTALVLLPTPMVNESNRDVTTEVRIITSASILAAAGKTLDPALDAVDVEHRIKVSSPTTQLIEIKATEHTAGNAMQIAQGVADAYVRYESSSAQAISGAALVELRSRESKLQGSVDALQREIKATTQRRSDEPPNSAAGRKDSQLLAQLQSEQADVTLQLDKVKEQIGNGLPEQALGGQPSVVQPATPAVRQAPLFSLLSMGGIGFLAAAVLAAMILIVRARRDRRIRTRDEIADALSGTVLASVKVRRARSVANWSLLLQSYQAASVDEWAYRQLLRSLVADMPADRRADKSSRIDYPASMTVVSLADDAKGLAVGPQLAAFTASRGINTRLITAVGGDHASALWAACSAKRHDNLRDHLLVGEVQPGEYAELTVVLAVVDRKQPEFGYSLHTDKVVVGVGAGGATEEELARLAVAVDDARGHIDGVVVADPDGNDRTTGRYSVEDRAKQIALPLRITGGPNLEAKGRSQR